MKKIVKIVSLLLALSLLLAVGAFVFTGCKGEDNWTRSENADWAFYINGRGQAKIAGTMRVDANGNTSTLGYALVMPAGISYRGVTRAVIGVADEAFYGDTTLRHVTIPASVTFIGESAFEGATALADVVFEGADSNTEFSLSYRSFARASALRRINLPAGLTEIAESAFQHAFEPQASPTAAASRPYLTTLILPNSVRYIRTAAFKGARIQRINMPNSLVRIEELGMAAFFLPAVTVIGHGATVTSHLRYQMIWCVEDEVYIQRPYEHITGTTDQMRERHHFSLPNSLSYIGERAFWHHHTVRRWSLPHAISEIGGGAFAGGGNDQFLLRFRNSAGDGYAYHNEHFRVGVNSLMSYDRTELIAFTANTFHMQMFIGQQSHATGANSMDQVTKIHRFAFGRLTFGAHAGSVTNNTTTIPARITYIGDYAFAGVMGADFVQEGFEPQRMPVFLIVGTNTQFSANAFAATAVLRVAGLTTLDATGAGTSSQSAQRGWNAERYDFLGNVITNDWQITGLG